MRKKNILITGCSSGIGKHCAIKLQNENWRVFATARKQKDLKMLEKAGVEAIYMDYTDKKSIHACFETVMQKTGGTLEALFNNGAYGQPGAVEDLTTDVLRKQFEANFFGWHELTNLVVPVMRAQGYGRIVHCSSILGWVSAPWRGAYNASKFALEGLASAMRIELKGSGIHVILIEPGPIKTDFSKHAHQAFLKNIDQKNSAHQERYEKELKRLESGGGDNRFRLEPSAVYDKLHHALNVSKPKAHYGVTIPTHVMNAARRFLPTSLVDKILQKNNS